VPGLVLANVSKSFAGPRRQNVGAVANLGLTVEPGEFLVIVGPSGCGKTTTLRLIAGLETPDSGDISLDGKSLTGVPPRDREVAMVFQNHALLPHLTVFENLGFGLMLRHFAKEEINKSVRHAADLLNLSPLLDRKPPELSGGECQRVALGRALVRQPKVFLFDEPLSNLDAPMRLQLRGEIAAVHRRVGAMMIYVTHDQAEAMALADRVAVMRDGALQQIAAPLHIYRRPANRFVASFIGSPPMSFFEGIITRNNGQLVFRGAFEIVLKDARFTPVDRYLDRPIILGARAEHIFETSPPGITALVERVEPTGPENLCYCSCKGAAFIMRQPAGHPAKAGQQLSLRFAPDETHFFDSQTGAAIP
jgi:multiple sugar transport system ATP-binding protein